MPSPKPLVAAALICEKVLSEKGGKGDILSAIRIVDTYTTVIRRIGQQTNEPVPASPPSDQILEAVAVLNMTALVILKAGDVTGHHDVSIVVRNPHEKETPFPNRLPVDFSKNDPADGAQLIIQFVMPGDAPVGLYWIDVRWDDELLTSIPLKLARGVLPGEAE